MANFNLYFVKFKRKKHQRNEPTFNDMLDCLTALRGLGAQPNYKYPFEWVESISEGFIVASRANDALTFMTAGTAHLLKNVDFDEVRKINKLVVFDFDLSDDAPQIIAHVSNIKDAGHTVDGFD
ncbi:hypothetical protein [Ectopseudomonas alcaliphila]|uniref:Uncharacterized protein n=1 Tax=Ectopseudomonas alcaliphila TaxID=101564 RepID=A0ABU4Q4J3_9GAMM|nr:hypothetical protein [Pseudomonas alcaliphila]MDX5995104.1 hypothetical protein [Pseudomonas alcaliphila]